MCDGYAQLKTLDTDAVLDFRALRLVERALEKAREEVSKV